MSYCTYYILEMQSLNRLYDGIDRIDENTEWEIYYELNKMLYGEIHTPSTLEAFKEKHSNNVFYADPLGSEMKWYEHEEDMIELSKKFPNVRFILYGEGEEWEDKWRDHYLNGQFHHSDAEITVKYEEPNF